MSYQLSDQQRLKNLIAEQQRALQVGVHFHPLPPPHQGATHHGLVGSESPLNTRLLRRPDSSPADSRMRTISGYSSPRSALPDLRAKGMQEEALRAAKEGKISDYYSPSTMTSVTSPNNTVARATIAAELGDAAFRISTPAQPRNTSRPATANNNTGASPRSLLLLQSQQQQSSSSPPPPFVGIPPRPPLDRQDLPAAQNLPSTTTHATSQPPRNATQALDEARTANPFYVAHNPPAIDIKTGEPIVEEDEHHQNQQQQSTRPPSSAPYRASQHLSSSKGAEYHESQREVLNLQLRGVADHSLKMRREVVDAVVPPVKYCAHEIVDLLNGCTAALKSYEENYDCVYQVKVPELSKLSEELNLRTAWPELSRVLELPAIDPETIRQALTELSAPIEEDPKEDALRVLSQSRLDLCRRILGKLDTVAGLSVADSALRMYEVLHTDILSAPRDLLATDEASLALMQKDVEKLYIKRANLLDEVQLATNRTAPLMADGPLSGTGAGSLTVVSSSPPTNTNARSLGLISPGAASRQISALMASEGTDKESDEIRAEVQRQLIEATPGAVRVHTVEALSPPRRGIVKTNDGQIISVPEDTEEDTEGRKLAVVENTQRREVNLSREILNRRTNRCNAMLDFVDGIRAFVSDALEQQKIGNEINQSNLKFIQRSLDNASDDINVISSQIQTEKDANVQAQQQYAFEQRESHTEMARLAQEEGELWQQIQKLVEKAHDVGKQRDAIFNQRLVSTEIEARRQKVHRLRLEKLSLLNVQLTRAKKTLARYQDAAQYCDNYHKTFVAEALTPKLQQEEELITLRGVEALGFASAFKNFIFSAEDLLGRLEVRGKILRQRQRAAGFDESVAQDSLDLAGRDTYLTEMRRLANMIEETEAKKIEVSDWIREGRENAKTFMPIAVAAREAAKRTRAIGTASANVSVIEPSPVTASRSLLPAVVASGSVSVSNTNSVKRPGSSAATRQKAEALADRIQDEDLDSAVSARETALRNVDRVEERLGREKQSAEEQVESLRSEIRRVRKENESQLRQQQRQVNVQQQQN